MSAVPIVVLDRTHPYPVYFAAVEEDGTLWSLTCTHLHHTPEAAHKCFPQVMKEWARWGSAERSTVGQHSNLVEMRLESVTKRIVILDGLTDGCIRWEPEEDGSDEIQEAYE